MFKRALVRPSFKKSALDHNLKGNFRPLSNLSFFSKVLEKCVFKQLVDHLDTNGLLGNCQSAYRQFHSCETALALVSNDILNYFMVLVCIACIFLILRIISQLLNYLFNTYSITIFLK